MQARHDRAMRDVGTLEARCPFCGKIQHITRKAAKRHVRSLPREHLSVYRCPAGTDMFHVGHLPEKVLSGDTDRRTMFAHTRRKCADRATMGAHN